MVSIDVSVIYQIVNFLVLIGVLNAILYRPIRKILLQRKDKITGLEQDFEAFNKGAREKEDAFASGIKAARAEGLKEKDVLIQAAEAEEKKIVQKINERAVADLTKVREKIAADAENVKNSLLKEVDRFASDIGKKILGRAV